MPTILRKYGYRFHFYSGDSHEPPHVHIDGQGRKAKIWLHDVSLARSSGFGELELRRIMGAVSDNRQMMLEARNEYFG
jgi:Domain of unknown function (DUF4160)